MEIVRQAGGRNVFFILYLAACMIIYTLPQWSLFRFSYHDDTFFYIQIFLLALVLLGTVLWALKRLEGAEKNVSDSK